jgi:dihydroorotate dehydrogenase (NAD+) catalytic subunit
MDSDNAIEFILAGATAVAVGTANFVQPDACERIVDGLECYVDENGLHSIREIVGGMII